MGLSDFEWFWMILKWFWVVLKWFWVILGGFEVVAVDFVWFWVVLDGFGGRGDPKNGKNGKENALQIYI